MNLFGTLLTTRRRTRATATAALLGCSAAFFLPGCRLPQLRGATSGDVMPEVFNEKPVEGNSAYVGIAEFFKDPVLIDLIHEGLVGNQELKILAEEIQIANNEVLARRGMIFPFFDLGGGAGLEKNSLFTPRGAVEENLDFRPGQGFPTPLPNFLVATTFTWQVDIWGQLRNARDAATLRYLGTADGRNYVITRLVAEIAENYYTLMALNERLLNLDQTIALQERSLEIAKASKEGARGTELPVQRFQAEVQKNQSEKLIIQQEIVEVQNRVNFLVGRFPQPVQRMETDFFELNFDPLCLGIPCELLLNRPDIRQAERELAASGLDVKVARAEFYPKLNITGGVGFEGFNPRYMVMSPESLLYNVAGELVAPVINRSAIKAEYSSANARQLQAVYKYQQVILNAYTEVANRISAVENYSKSIEIKKQQLESLKTSVDVAGKLFNATRIEYFDVLFAQRDLMEARMDLIETKRLQLAAVVNTYQALGGGLVESEYVDAAFTVPEESLPPVPTSEGHSEEVPTEVPPLPETN
ncbi:MAG TPA: efflux transporter outer membrane subunit [Planctomicrobium sp.]|nr:efflux transporter outer membrane subunit [Planctomicrobium sp.]